ncbi:hypothetical protein CCR85_02835 [Rhodothalassium salexigens]|uniref:hypothetical protein n=1 Tax=Rhodothalassium salexigens TaxID=1086 RepID=UPI0019144FB9|nr:hypothetical protein [Rhodothalassium salexigens]MBK5910426.1 hypothetical protein [Rhodothalassium salexigens]MBK5919825.1 hypothetical protein [Rhodothalassium salexigens]
MTIDSAQATAIAGLQAAQTSFETSAVRLSQSAAGGAEGRIVKDIVDLRRSAVAFDANVRTVKASDEMLDTLLGRVDERA